jgi:hypothetical protein
MPRADPTRSAYCASRHLLRNLDDAAELRRNPLVRAHFASARRDGGDNGRALDTVRGLVHASLVRCRDRAHAGRARGALGRMHAALLRCEIDKQPLAVVAAELGLSDRQVRRERRAAHDAFLDAFGAVAGDARGALVRDTATLRLAEASELHELGQSALAASACEAIAASAPDPLRRVEALCLAAEIDMDAARHAAAAARAADANALLALRAPELDESARAHAAELVDFVAWSLRRETGVSAGLATPPPLAVAQAASAAERDEPRRALLVRALAAYASQRWDIGDALRMRDAVRRAQHLLPTLDASRAKERLAVMYADAQHCGLQSVAGDRDRFLAIEQIAERRGYVRTLLRARAERIGTDVSVANGGEGVLDEIVRPFEPGDRRAMPCALASAARIAAQCELDLARGVADAQLAESLVPARSATALFARCWRTKAAIWQGDLDGACALAHAAHHDAELLGNGRIRGAAACDLAAIAFARRRRADGERYLREALSLLDRFGTPMSRARVHALAHHAQALPANITRNTRS